MSAVVREQATASFKMNHTMIRVKDIKKSLAFYEGVLGMTLIHQAGGDDFTNYFLVFAQEGKSIEEQAETIFDREGVVELCHNHGTESDASFKGYANGNEDPGRGFGHLCISTGSVSLEDACKRFTDLGVEFKKRPEEGRMRHIAFLYDPDRYWIEVVAGNTKV